jgi:hypothetical protein
LRLKNSLLLLPASAGNLLHFMFWISVRRSKDRSESARMRKPTENGAESRHESPPEVRLRVFEIGWGEPSLTQQRLCFATTVQIHTVRRQIKWQFEEPDLRYRYPNLPFSCNSQLVLLSGLIVDYDLPPVKPIAWHNLVPYA